MIIDRPALCAIQSLKDLWHEAFDDSDESVDWFFANAYRPDHCRVVTENGEVCAALYFFDCEYLGQRIAYIYAVATAKKHRGRGLCRALMEDTHKTLSDLGYSGAILVPGSESLFRLYGSMGYKTCGYVREFSCVASSEAATLRQLDEEEYSFLRQRYLPENGVLQEGVNITYLASYNGLYAFDGGVVAARRDGELLICAEILGDLTAASGIIPSLGCKNGVFRTVGEERPFAMSVSFGDAEIWNVYFGLAFD